MTVQIIRLKDGFDVVSQLEYKRDEVELTNPMVFEIRNTALVLQHWLPLAVMEGNSVVIHRDEILCVMNPNENFREYYETTVKKINTVVESKNEDELEELASVLEELENQKGIQIH